MTTTDNSDADCCTLVSLKTNSTLPIPSLMLRRLISFSLLVKLNSEEYIQCHGFLWCCSCRIESNVSLNPRISVLKLRFNRVSVFLLRLFSVREIPVILSLDYRLHQKHLVFSLR